MVKQVVEQEVNQEQDVSLLTCLPPVCGPLLPTRGAPPAPGVRVSQVAAGHRQEREVQVGRSCFYCDMCILLLLIPPAPTLTPAAGKS